MSLNRSRPIFQMLWSIIYQHNQLAKVNAVHSQHIVSLAIFGSSNNWSCPPPFLHLVFPNASNFNEHKTNKHVHLLMFVNRQFSMTEEGDSNLAVNYYILMLLCFIIQTHINLNQEIILYQTKYKNAYQTTFGTSIITNEKIRAICQLS